MKGCQWLSLRRKLVQIMELIENSKELWGKRCCNTSRVKRLGFKRKMKCCYKKSRNSERRNNMHFCLCRFHGRRVVGHRHHPLPEIHQLKNLSLFGCHQNQFCMLPMALEFQKGLRHLIRLHFQLGQWTCELMKLALNHRGRCGESWEMCHSDPVERQSHLNRLEPFG